MLSHLARIHSALLLARYMIGKVPKNRVNTARAWRKVAWEQCETSNWVHACARQKRSVTASRRAHLLPATKFPVGTFVPAFSYVSEFLKYLERLHAILPTFHSAIRSFRLGSASLCAAFKSDREWWACNILILECVNVRVLEIEICNN